MSLQSTMATLSMSSERYTAWMRVFGTCRIPILAPVPQEAMRPEGGTGLFYRVDVAALTPDQRGRLVVFLAAKFHLAAKDVEEGIDGEHGCPILAEDVIVSFDMRFAL